MKKLLFLLLLPLQLFAQAPTSLVHNTSTCIDDFADILTDDEETVLNSKLKKFFDTAQISVVTVPTLNGIHIADFGTELFNYWHIGQKGSNNGVLILIAPNEHKHVIRTGYGVEGDLTDGICGEILRNAVPHFKNNDYFKGIDGIISQTIEQLSPSAKILKKEAIAAKNKINEEETAKFMENLGYFVLISMIFGLIFYLFRKWYNKYIQEKNRFSIAKKDYLRNMNDLAKSKYKLQKFQEKYSKYVSQDIEYIFSVYNYYLVNKPKCKTADEYLNIIGELFKLESTINTIFKDFQLIEQTVKFLDNNIPSKIEEEYEEYKKITAENLLFDNAIKVSYMESYSERVKNYIEKYSEVSKLLNNKQYNSLRSQMNYISTILKSIKGYQYDILNVINSNEAKILEGKNAKQRYINILTEAVEYNQNRNKVDNSFYLKALDYQAQLRKIINSFNGDVVYNYNLAKTLGELEIGVFSIRNEISRIEAEERRLKQEAENRRKSFMKSFNSKISSRSGSEYSGYSGGYSSNDYTPSPSTTYDSGSSNNSYDFSGGSSGGGGADGSW